MESDTPRKSIDRYLCRCCNRFSPSQERPIGLFGRKAKKERTVELIFEFGHVRMVENDGCGQLICKQCFAKVTKIQKLIRDFREACISTEEKQKEARDLSKCCRREECDNRDENINQPLTKHRYLPIYPIHLNNRTILQRQLIHLQQHELEEPCRFQLLEEIVQVLQSRPMQKKY